MRSANVVSQSRKDDNRSGGGDEIYSLTTIRAYRLYSTQFHRSI